MKWTAQDIATLRMMAEFKTAREIAMIVGRSPAAVNQFAHQHNIKLPAWGKRQNRPAPRDREPDYSPVPPLADFRSR